VRTLFTAPGPTARGQRGWGNRSRARTSLEATPVRGQALTGRVAWLPVVGDGEHLLVQPAFGAADSRMGE